MDPRLLQYYNRELQHLREMGAEFAVEHPKIAARLGIDGFECIDPYVERLLEGFSFLAARVQLKIDAEFPKFTQHLLEAVFPGYLAPIPSMAVVQFQPNLAEGALSSGYVVPRGAGMTSQLGKGIAPCQFRSAQAVTLWPVELVSAQYAAHAREVPAGVSWGPRVRASMRWRLRTNAGGSFDQLPIDELSFFLRGPDGLGEKIYERLLGEPLGLSIGKPGTPLGQRFVVQGEVIHPRGFDENEALLPYGTRAFHGYRLLREYFAFPNRFLFVSLAPLREGIRRVAAEEVELTLYLGQSDPALESAVAAEHFALYCTPAINLFEKRADRIPLTDRLEEFHLIPDRTRPIDYEVYQVLSVMGHGTRTEGDQTFEPFFRVTDKNDDDDQAYYTAIRRPRVVPEAQGGRSDRTGYVGSELFLSLVDAREAPWRSDLRELSVNTLCTNRDLPLLLGVKQGPTDFQLEAGAPVAAVRCVAGPTRPRPSFAEGDHAWRLVSHLSLNYLSLCDADPENGATTLRDLLALYADPRDPALQKQVDGVRRAETTVIRRRLPLPGPLTFGRGLQLTLTFDEAKYVGGSYFLLSAVLARFFAKYVALNSFTELTVKTLDGNEVHRWPMQLGTRQAL